MIMILGPNGVGKTRIAYELARRHDGEIINLDRTYLYRYFPITTGLNDTLKEHGVGRHLYELLDPREDSIVPADFLEMVRAKGSQILAGGKIAIAEGGSTLYVPPLLELNKKKEIFQHIIGLRFPRDFDIEGQYLRRIDLAVEEGLVDEIAANLTQYQHSFLIKECHFAVPIVKYLKKEMNLMEAKALILWRCLDYKDRQLSLFSNYSEIKWVEATSFEETYSRVGALIGRAALT